MIWSVIALKTGIQECRIWSGMTMLNVAPIPPGNGAIVIEERGARYTLYIPDPGLNSAKPFEKTIEVFMLHSPQVLSDSQSTVSMFAKTS